MNTAAYVAEMIEKWKASGAEKWRIAWSAALLCVDWPYVFGAWGAECTPSERRRRKRDDHPTIVTKCQVLNGSRATCSECKWFPEGKTVRCFDCRGFTDWCLNQAGIDLKGEGATSQWNTASNWLRKGVIETMPENTLVCLFVQKGTKMEHTGFGLNNETCECSVGVQHFTKRNKKWTHWAIPRGLYEGNKKTETDPVSAEQGAQATVRPVLDSASARSESGRNDRTVLNVPFADYPTLRRGSTGDAVKQLQAALMMKGYDCGTTGADGVFGKNTEAAVRKFQWDNGLTVDGICGPRTYAALEDASAQQLYTVHIPLLSLFKAEALMKTYSGAYMTKESEAI